jgi:hypothetical protein
MVDYDSKVLRYLQGGKLDHAVCASGACTHSVSCRQ